MIGLYFGSFNPIHNGHLIVAQYFYNTGLFSKILFVVSPQNPFKNSSELIPENLRLQWVKNAIKNNPNFECTDIECTLPKPNYTIDTLHELKKIWPKEQFGIIMGSDNLAKLHEWKKIEEIAQLANFFVYKRDENKSKINANITIFDAPFLSISGTEIRRILNNQQSIRYLIPDCNLEAVENYFQQL